jgi:O-antigen biosynthesis protein
MTRFEAKQTILTSLPQDELAQHRPAASFPSDPSSYGGHTHDIIARAVQPLANQILESLATLVQSRTWWLAQLLNRTTGPRSRRDTSAVLASLTSAVRALAALSTATVPRTNDTLLAADALRKQLGDLTSSKPLLLASRLTFLLSALGFKAYAPNLIDRVVVLGDALPTVSKALTIFEPSPSQTTPSSLDFPRPGGDPLVSVIVPVGKGFTHTFTCLRAVRDKTLGVDYEVIVVDDGSDDATSTMLAEVREIRVIRGANGGIAGTRMSGAEVARGRYLVFLIDDTVVRGDWLPALIDEFQTNSEAGLVGAKILFPNGNLQAAGTIVSRNGMAENFGKTDDPDRPEYNYMREVDCCSGACMAIPRDLFYLCGGFDLKFSPAYQDADLAFRVRGAGKKVLYQPKAEVVRIKETTNGSDVSSEPERDPAVDQEMFLRKWSGILENHQESGADAWRAQDRYIRGRVLVIDWAVPVPSRDSGSLRLFTILQILRGLGYKVTLLPGDLVARTPDTERLQSQGIEVIFSPYITDIRSFLRTEASRYDVIVLCRMGVAEKYIDTVRRSAPNSFTIFDTVDLHFVRIERQGRLFGDQETMKQAEGARKRECRLASLADLTLVVSAVERETLLRELPSARVEVLSNIHEVREPIPPFSARRDILFIGGFNHPPNADAVLYFADAIWPVVRKELPGVRFFVLGANPPDELQRLHEVNIIVTGNVANAAEYFQHCRISIAPLRYGAGVKGKITQSMSYGVPAVATPVAAEGTHSAHEENMLVASSAEDFAKAVVRLYTDEALWVKLSRNGLANVRENFSLDAARSTLQRVLETTALRTKSSNA